MTELANDPEQYPQGDERTVLASFLDYYRTVLIRKAEGLSVDGAGGNRVRVLLDQDDPSAPSELCEVKLTGDWVA